MPGRPAEEREAKRSGLGGAVGTAVGRTGRAVRGPLDVGPAAGVALGAAAHSGLAARLRLVDDVGAARLVAGGVGFALAPLVVGMVLGQHGLGHAETVFPDRDRGHGSVTVVAQNHEVIAAAHRSTLSLVLACPNATCGISAGDKGAGKNSLFPSTSSK